MGQNPSKFKRSSAGSTEPLTSASQYTIAEDPSNGITQPAAARRIHHLSEIIDLDDLFPSHQPTSISDMHSAIDAQIKPPKPPARARTIIQSPSGQELDAYQYMSRPDRPLTMQERQARITERLEQESRMESERRREYMRVMQAKDAIENKKRNKRKGCFGCWR